MDFYGYFRWFHANRDALESMIQILAQASGVKCEAKHILGTVQTRLIVLGLDPAFSPELWQWMQMTFRMVWAELDVLRFNPWWERERKSLKAYAQDMMAGYRTRQELDDLLQDAYLLMVLRLKNTRLKRLNVSRIKAYVKRVIFNTFISRYRGQKRERPLPEDFDQSDALSPSVIDRMRMEELRQELRRRAEACWQQVRLEPNEQRAMSFWVQADFDRQTALRLMGIAGDDKKTARQYDQPFCRAKRKVFPAFFPLAALVRELTLAESIDELKRFLSSKLAL